MLVLTRKLQEKIRISDNIVVTVLRVKGNSVRLGIEAPREVRVVRGELPPKDEFGEVIEPEGEAEPEPLEVGAEEDAEGGERNRQRTLKDYLAAAV